jgi:hypothetical protein
MWMPALTVVAATLLTASAPDEAKPPRKEQIEESAKKIKELQKERIAALKEMAEITTRLSMNGRTSPEEALEATLLVFQAQLEAAEKESDRIALYKKMIDSLKGLETLAEERMKTARGTAATVLKVKARRLEAEIHLEQAKIKEAKEGK